MNSNDLFSFLDEAPVDNEEPYGTDKHVLSPNNLPQKRKCSPPGEAIDKLEDEPGPSPHKKLRIPSPKPVVLDDFETEAKREVAASAGLTGGVEAGSRLELRHQVQRYYTFILVFHLSLTFLVCRSVTK
jgi:ATP-dependent RNA helicase DOB1